MNALAWHAQIPARIGHHMLLKAVGTTAFITLFFVAYFWVLKNPLFTVTTMPLTWADRAVAFWPPALPAYLSLWFYVSIPPSLLHDRRTLKYYGIAVGVLCMVGLTCFILWPTTIPPLLTGADTSAIALLQGMDAAGNACPSLHVATALYSCLWLQRILTRMGAPAWVHASNWLWSLAITWSTLAVKQHVFVDVLGGVVLGVGGAWLALAWYDRHMARYGAQI
jgi:membrane-associated phospholipid phosphatase